MTTDSESKLTLYGYFRSSCTSRVRIALKFKGLDYEYIPVNVKNGVHLDEEYRKVNPSRQVPTLFVPGNKVPITQSGAALEYLEERYPDTPPLLPRDTFARAQVRSLVNLVVADIQPVTNLKIMKKASSLGYDSTKWSREYHEEGLAAFEAIIKETAGTYCFGDEVTLADVCLAPAMWNAERWGVDFGPYPTVRKVYENASKVRAFAEGHWKKQPDCPDDLK